MKVRYSEIFNSFQGEAGFAGTPAVWLRTFGCNLECNGFGQKNPLDPSTYVLPYQTIELKNFTKLEDLPVFEYGCDSSYSWSNRFKNLAHDATTKEIADMLWEKAQELGANVLWKHQVTNQDIQLCFTGGEPGLWDKQLAEIVFTLVGQGKTPSQITVETNGTKLFPKLERACNAYFIKLFYSVSPKLMTVSGERGAVDFKVLDSLIRNGEGWLKFVVDGSKLCWTELDIIMEELGDAIDYSMWDVWIMPVGATKEQQEKKTIAQIANEGMKRGYKIATRNHAYVYGNLIGK